jgi:hypothetical protein
LTIRDHVIMPAEKLKEKINDFDKVADTILGAHVAITIDDCTYLIPEVQKQK